MILDDDFEEYVNDSLFWFTFYRNKLISSYSVFVKDKRSHDMFFRLLRKFDSIIHLLNSF